MPELETLLAELGMEDISPREDEVYARCPQHERRTGRRENRPRHWSINRATGAHYCFSCGYKGSLLTLIVDLTRQSPWEARKKIREHRLDFAAWAERMRPVEKALDEYEPGDYIDLSERLECFGDPPGTALRQRGLQRPSVDRYGVRWDLDDKAWVLPIRGPYGDVWGYQTKSENRVLNHPSGVHKSRTLFGLDLLVEQPPAFRDYVILVESPLDVVYVDGWGYPAVSSFGVVVSDRQLRLLTRFFDRFILALDNDDAGKREMRRLVKSNWAKQRPIEVLNYRRASGKDPGEMDEAQFVRAVETSRSRFRFR
jgi:hypothetical protein